MTKEARTYHGVKTVSSINGVGQIGQIHAKKKRKKEKKRNQTTFYTRKNSKRIKDLSLRLEIIKILEENIGSKISNISGSNIFF